MREKMLNAIAWSCGIIFVAGCGRSEPIDQEQRRIEAARAELNQGRDTSAKRENEILDMIQSTGDSQLQAWENIQ